MIDKKIYILTIVSVLFLSACTSLGDLMESDTLADNSLYEETIAKTSDNDSMPETFELGIEVSYFYLTFEEALLNSATDVVVAQYITSRPFGQNTIEFEFAVSERILGNAADRIFVYVDKRLSASVIDTFNRAEFTPGDLTFNQRTNYLLPLVAIIHPLANTHDDGFGFIRNIVIDLDNPSRSTMYNMPLSQHSESLDFDSRTSSREIISFVSDLTRHNQLGSDFIRSEAVEEIINESPYVLVVEINEPLSLSYEQSNTDWMLTDLYNATVVRALKGNISAGTQIVVEFAADTVFQEELHTIAAERIREGSNWFIYTSRNSLFQMEQLSEITQILESQY